MVAVAVVARKIFHEFLQKSKIEKKNLLRLEQQQRVAVLDPIIQYLVSITFKLFLFCTNAVGAREGFGGSAMTNAI